MIFVISLNSLESKKRVKFDTLKLKQETENLSKIDYDDIYYVTKSEIGVVSFYGKSHHGRRTASGERFDMYKMTAAHKKLPFGTMIRVTNLKNNKCVVVRITDRGPYVKGRILDISEGAAKLINNTGLLKCKIEILKRKTLY